MIPANSSLPVLRLTLLAVASVSFAAAMILPLFRMEPRADEWTDMLRLLAPRSMQTVDVTLLGGIGKMIQGGEGALAVVLFLFSVLLPLLKLSSLTLEVLAPGQLPARWSFIMGTLARYAMVEVFVISLLVMLAKGMPGGSQLQLGAGTTAFVISILSSLLVSHFSAKPTAKN
jgi:uncharacterized paraquat-inducible protein A